MSETPVTTITPDLYVAHQLADLMATVVKMAAQEGADAAAHLGEPECIRHLARLSMAREIAVVIEKRIAVLTGAAPTRTEQDK